MTAPFKLALGRSAITRCDCNYRPHKYRVTVPISTEWRQRRTIAESTQVEPANGINYQPWENRYRVSASMSDLSLVKTNGREPIWKVDSDLFSWLNEDGIAYCRSLSQLHARMDSLITELVTRRVPIHWEILDAVCLLGPLGSGHARLGRCCPNCYAAVLQALADAKNQPITVLKAPEWLDIRLWTPLYSNLEPTGLSILS